MSDPWWIAVFDKPVRPLVTLGFAATICYLSWDGKVPPEALIGVAGPIFGFWFRERTEEKREERLIEAALAAPPPTTPKP